MSRAAAGRFVRYHLSMIPRLRSSRRRFRQYRADVKARRRGEPVSPHAVQTFGKSRRDYRRARSFFELFGEFVGMLGGHRMIIVASLAALMLATILGLAPLYLPKIVIDNILDHKPAGPWLDALLPLQSEPGLSLTLLAVFAVVVTAIATAVALWARWHMTRVSKRLQVEVRRRVFNHAARLPLHRVYELKSGGVAGILRDDAGSVGDLLFAMLYNPWRAITQLVGSLIILVLVDWKLLLGALAIAPIIWFTHRLWISRIRPMWRDVRQTRRLVDAHATEAFGGMRVVRGFGRQLGEAATFTRNNNMMARQELYTWWWMRGIDTAWSILVPLASATLLWYGGMRVLHDQAAVVAGHLAPSQALTAGDLVMFLGYLAALLGPVATLAAGASGLQNNLAGLDRVLDLLEEPQEMPSPPDAITIDPRRVQGEIRLDHVWFEYPNTQDAALRDVSLEAPPGKVIALVGSSGAGKTTLCNLIARFYDPTRGSITLDGIDLRKIDVESYRRLLGIVEQDIFLFDGTVADNIGYGRRDASRRQIIEAAKLANAHEFIVDMPDDYDTWVGERGVKLSGGQRQRLAIARALLADPRILILDEATSNLDTESERLIQASLRTLMRDRTSFVIAHRLSTITDADQIVVLEHGQVIETGRHHELMRRSGRYRQMVELQLSPVLAAAQAAQIDLDREPTDEDYADDERVNVNPS